MEFHEFWGSVLSLDAAKDVCVSLTHLKELENLENQHQWLVQFLIQMTEFHCDLVGLDECLTRADFEHL